MTHKERTFWTCNDEEDKYNGVPRNDSWGEWSSLSSKAKRSLLCYEASSYYNLCACAQVVDCHGCLWLTPCTSQ
ncbi:MAG: hypothetical protein J6C85_06690 [Alphaproteobacteria bacterium]|nr:hypothetical protein [Alphaproteobacteria bacterium]